MNRKSIKYFFIGLNQNLEKNGKFGIVKIQ